MFLQMIANHELTMLQKKENFIAWLKVFAEKVGDCMPDEEAIILPYPKFEGVCLEYKQERHAKKKIIVTTAIAAVFFMKTFQTSDWFDRKAVLSAAKFVRAAKHGFSRRGLSKK